MSVAAGRMRALAGEDEAAAGTRTGAAERERRVLFLQFGNPGAFPPLHHSARILARRGWQVRVVGVVSPVTAPLRFPAHPRIETLFLRERAGRAGRLLTYLLFLAKSLQQLLFWRPDWVYVSDALAAPAGVLALLGGRRGVLYHEHDAPDAAGAARTRLWLAARSRLLRAAHECVAPNAERARRMELERGRGRGRGRDVRVVWNCPEREEVPPAPVAREPGLELVYHGTLVPERVPLTLVDAVALVDAGVRLLVIGYETVGAPGHAAALLARAAELGISGRVRVLPPLGREEILEISRRGHVGIALMPMRGRGVNLEHMVGASNKVFDYLACGLAVLVSRLPAWESAFVQPGFGVACDPSDARDVAAALRRLAADPAAVAGMGERGRRRILESWNYETQFEGVLRALESPAPARES